MAEVRIEIAKNQLLRWLQRQVVLPHHHIECVPEYFAVPDAQQHVNVMVVRYVDLKYICKELKPLNATAVKAIELKLRLAYYPHLFGERLPVTILLQS